MRKKRRWPLVCGAVLLALLCIGVVELMVCRVVDPALYQTLTAPARAWWRDVRQTVVQLLPRPTDPPQESQAPIFEAQLAGAPALALELEPEEAATRLDQREDGDWLAGGSTQVRYFRQSAPEWSSLPYGRDNIGGYGCGPTAMAMAISSLTDQVMDPQQMADWAYENGHWAKGSGSRLSLVEDACAAFGLMAQPMADPTPEDLLGALTADYMAVALMTTGHFTQGGHFILLRGATLEGRILVADPNSLERSLVSWDPQLILDELSPSRHNGAPLWLISIAP